MVLTSITKVRSVPLREWPDVIIAVLIATGVEVGLRTVTLPRLASFVGAPLDVAERRQSPVGPRRRLPVRLRRRLRATRRVMRHWPFGSTCLRQALVIGSRCRSLDPVLRLGVAKLDGDVRAHAWLEIDGVVVDPMRAAEFYGPLERVRPASIA